MTSGHTTVWESVGVVYEEQGGKGAKGAVGRDTEAEEGELACTGTQPSPAQPRTRQEGEGPHLYEVCRIGSSGPYCVGQAWRQAQRCVGRKACVLSAMDSFHLGPPRMSYPS